MPYEVQGYSHIAGSDPAPVLFTAIEHGTGAKKVFCGTMSPADLAGAADIQSLFDSALAAGDLIERPE